MIDSALSFVKQVLNQQLKNQFGLEADTVIANHLVEANGNPPLANQNKMVLTLINLESETNKQFYGGNRGVQGSSIQQLQPAARFNLDILLTASFDVYNEALKFLSATIAFFQANPTLTKQLFPTMPDSLVQLQFDIENSPYLQTHNLWSALGAKYQPSVIFKIRHVTIQANETSGEVAAVQGITSEATP